MPEFGRHCAEIMEGRHPDVLEMDAASNTGVDNIREIIESARYRPLVARYKVYLIDEVHMLSKGAFNALLKTLEEPPEHVKFIFATTEVRKVPVTVLSRCQRFDLRRVDVPRACRSTSRRSSPSEGAKAEDDGAGVDRTRRGGLRARGLSLLDQALAMGAGSVARRAACAQCSGLADRGRIFDLLETADWGMRPARPLERLLRLHRDGAEPGQVLADLAEAVHIDDARQGARASRPRAKAFRPRKSAAPAALGGRLSVPILSRAWQMLLKGLEEVGDAPNRGRRRRRWC